ncbi:hypothetical protein K491DRAFT_479064 [Lophiostoma macrostomum CBS 122681]|uniref:Uncharacterized protein n=1 Tax=Lophiostoma macrostomum CBS 122681 TaxID=1314788 RepID=A0A6A6TRA2_9PLEO|nr:hypothetical protein K491DRAFT_479064 [Lophiostoma macrostomum CBS 122681]
MFYRSSSSDVPTHSGWMDARCRCHLTQSCYFESLWQSVSTWRSASSVLAARTHEREGRSQTTQASGTYGHVQGRGRSDQQAKLDEGGPSFRSSPNYCKASVLEYGIGIVDGRTPQSGVGWIPESQSMQVALDCQSGFLLSVQSSTRLLHGIGSVHSWPKVFGLANVAVETALHLHAESAG